MSDKKCYDGWQVVSEQEIRGHGGWVMTMTMKPMPVANPDGIVPETKIDAFVRRLNETPNRLGLGPFRAEPWRYLHNVYSGDRIVGVVEGHGFTVAKTVPPVLAKWLRDVWRSAVVADIAEWTTWRSSDAAPEVPPRVQRFLDTLTGSRFTCRARLGEIVRGPFTAKFYPKEGLTEFAGNGVQFGTVLADCLRLYGQIIGEDAAASLKRMWEESGHAPSEDVEHRDFSVEIPMRVHRFLTALTDYDITFRDDYDYTVKAPFTTTVLPSQNVIIVLGNGVEFGEVRGDDFTPDTAMPCDIRAILRHVWRETVREETLLNRIATLEAECADKTRRLDQIAAIIKGDK